MIGMVIVGAYLRFIGNPSSFLTYEGLIPKALLIVITIQLSLYYFDLYDLKTFRSNLELVVRLFQSLGISSIVLAICYYMFPMLIIGRGIFLISLSFMAGVIISWRIIYNHILKTRQLDQKIIIVGSGQLAKNIAKEIISNAVAACSKDYRFAPISLGDLPDLKYEVSILSKPELLEDVKNHDPKKYGLIARCADGRCGLLLPDLDGIDTLDDQFSISCQKGGIDPENDKPRLYFFTVEKRR